MLLNLVGLDYETYSGTDLIKHGLERYVTDPHFTPLIARTSKLGGFVPQRYDFVTHGSKDIERLRDYLVDRTIVAHNAGFEKRVLEAIGIPLPSNRFIDSAVVARMAGAAGKLEAAGPQLL